MRATAQAGGAGAKRIRQRGKNAYRTPGDPGEGPCVYCGRWGPRSNDHVLPRSTFPQHRNDRRNLVPACADCNRRREDTAWRPPWHKLPVAVREWALSVATFGRLERYFTFSDKDMHEVRRHQADV